MMEFHSVPLAPLLRPCQATTKLLVILETLRDRVPFDVYHGPFIAGGILVRALLGIDEVNDVDLFCCTEKQVMDVLAQLPPGQGPAGDQENPGNPDTQSMGGGRNVTQVYVNGIRTQIIGGNWKEPWEILMSFDLFHCMLATDGKVLFAHRDAVRLVWEKLIRVNENPWRQALLKERPKLAKNASRISKYETLGFRLEKDLTPTVEGGMVGP
jgi:hypothetical protein